MAYVIRALNGAGYVANPFGLETKYVPLAKAYRFKSKERAEPHVWEGRETIDRVM